MRSLIVSADDFGLSRGVNRAICNAHAHGIVKNASILANGNDFEDAVFLSKSVPFLGMGLHLNFLRGRPLSSRASVSSLCEKKGNFLNNLNLFLSRYAMGYIREIDVYREGVTQIMRVLNAGLAISHLDTEKHLNRLPMIQKVLIRIAQQFGIRKIRYAPRYLSLPCVFGFTLSGCALKVLRQNYWNASATASSGLLHPGTVLCFNFKRSTCAAAAKDIVSCINEGLTELVMHPSLAGDDYPKNWGGFNRSEFATHDYNFATSKEAEEVFLRNNIRLISYRDFN
jgi:chitin disaccharide deacetylase